MGTDVTTDPEPLPYPHSFKVHHPMCTELMKLVDCIAKIFPEIEAARPRSASGIQTLCLFNSAFERAKNLLQYCSEASKLYLAITGDVIVSRCKRARDLLEQSLVQIQNMVPVTLAAKISQIVDNLRSVTFTLEPSEEEAGKIMKELLQHNASASDSTECSELKALQFAASTLHITSSKAVVVEKRSIKRMLDKVGDSDARKKKILKYLLYLLMKNGNSITGHQANVVFTGSVCNHSVEIESHVEYEQHEPGNDFLIRAIPPEEFKCPLSMRVMYDPVVVSSGQTFERMWIQKWFDEGNEMCPKTKIKLAHQSLTPNSTVKDLISKWCMNYGVNIPDPYTQQDSYQFREASNTSIASLGSSMNDLRFPLDISNVSLGSMVQMENDSRRSQPVIDVEDIGFECLTRLAEIHWESQCDMVENVKNRLRGSNQACQSMSSENYIEPVIKFVTDARDCRDTRAQRSGFQLLFELVSTNSSGRQYFSEDTFSVLASFLDSEITEEALAVMEILSDNPFHRSRITGPTALSSIINFLVSEIRDYQVQSLKILQNLSFTRDFSSCIVPSECIPKLAPFLTDNALARHSLIILRNMCDTEEARECIAETKTCLGNIVGLLEIGSHEEQAHAVSVLLSLCLQKTRYCRMVMDEGVIPALVSISINGNEKGKVFAMELLRLLRDIQPEEEQKQEQIESESDTSYDFPREKKSSSKASAGFLGMKISIFSKTKSLAVNQRK